MRSAASLLRPVCAAALTLATLPAHATFYVVTRNDDPVPNGCAVGDCSLREAILDASAAAGPLHFVSLGTATYGLPRGGLTFAGQIEILGAGSTATTIEGDGIEPVLSAADGASIRLLGLAIKAHGQHALDASGDGDTLLFQVRIPEPDSQVWVQGFSAGAGSLSVEESDLHAYATCGHVKTCKIVHSQMQRLTAGLGDDVDIDITDSTFDGDRVPAEGAYVAVQSTASVKISRTTLRNSPLTLSSAPSSIAIDHVRYENNDRPVHLAAPADLTIDASKFVDNDNPHGLGNGAGALWISNSGATATVTRSTFEGNAGSDVAGGAVLVENGAALTLRNSTFSNNTFTGTGVGTPRGAAIGFIDADTTTTLVLDHVTIVAPSVVPVGVTGTALGGNGGESGLALSVFNSILRGSCDLDPAAMDANFGNIESAGNSCQFSASDNQTGVSAAALALGTLADHGGPTRTYKPGAFSPAIDAADAAFCPATDQRGYPRPFGDGCDVGAVEADADVLFKDGFE